jgi:hypothetical protein
MTFSTLLKTGLGLLLITLTGCSGDSTSTSDYTRETTYKSEKQVVNGLVYGYTGKTLSGISGAPRLYTSFESGQYAIPGYSKEPTVNESVLYASFTDGSGLYSVWSGLPAATADVTVTFDQEGLVSPSNVNVRPDNFESRANINPITDLAYWYWLYDNKQSPYGYYYYLTSVFQFFQGMYYIPEQNAVHDYPSPEMLQMFNEIQVKLSTDATETNYVTGFSLINNATGNTICTSTFAQFPICY